MYDYINFWKTASYDVFKTLHVCVCIIHISIHSLSNIQIVGKLHTMPKFKLKNQQGVRDELRSAAEIRKLQKEKSNQKMKNTGKAKRTVLEARNRKAKNEAKNSLSSVVKRNLQAQGRNRKSKLIVRM
jgi:hypothetical protein